MSALLCAAACSDGEEQEIASSVSSGSEEVDIAFVAGMQGNSLQKTAFADDGHAINLLGNERLVVVADDSKHTTFDIKNTTAAVSTFNGKTTQAVLDAAQNFVAMYPEGEYYNGKYIMYIPDSQTATLNSFDPKANLLIASTTKDAMKFDLKNVCSFVKVTVSVPVEWVKLFADNAIAGEVTVNTEGTCEGGSENAITLQPADGEETIAPGTYYIAVKPGKVTNLEIKTDVHAAVSVAEFEFKRNQIHTVTFKTVKSAGLDSYLKSLTLADGEVATIELADYEWETVRTALLNNLDKKVYLKLPDNGMTSIPNQAFCRVAPPNFFGCTNLVNIDIPESVESIGVLAFRLCTSLALETLPSGITSIGNAAFEVCTSLQNLTINSTPTLGSFVFDNCSHDLKVIVNEATYLNYGDEGKEYHGIMVDPRPEVKPNADLENLSEGNKIN